MTTMFKKKTETTKKQQDEDRNEDTKEDTTKNWEKQNKVKIEKDDNINVDQRLLLIPTLKISMNAYSMKKRASRDNNQGVICRSNHQEHVLNLQPSEVALPSCEIDEGNKESQYNAAKTRIMKPNMGDHI